jgi:hypothetical protein
MTELEEQLNKKKKNKKKNECLECFKKEAELQTLNNKLMLLTQQTETKQSEMDK